MWEKRKGEERGGGRDGARKWEGSEREGGKVKNYQKEKPYPSLLTFFPSW